MSSLQENYSFLDKLLLQIDQGISTFAKRIDSSRPYPATQENPTLSEKERKISAGLMRVNHSGEVAAQGLYQGQALTARNQTTKIKLQQSALEENDHLAWCSQRLSELNSRASILNPLWYVGSLTIGAMAGLAGDQWSLGFVAETERQVLKHLESHEEKLPQEDQRSREVIRQMHIDEAHHAEVAIAAGAANLPTPIKILMKGISKIMTTTAYRW